MKKMALKRQAILDAAIQSFNVDGFGATTSKIAKLAGVGTGTLFNYYPTKEALIIACYAHIKEEYLKVLIEGFNVEGDTAQKAKSTWFHQAYWGIENTEKRKLLMKLERSHYRDSKAIKEVKKGFKIIETEMVNYLEGVIEVSVEPDLIFELWMSQLDTTVLYIEDRSITSIESVLEASFNILWQGLIYVNGK